MKAMVLAAGLGTRLGELGRTTPKCLVQAGGKSMLEHVITRLRQAGVTEIVINLFHLGEQIESFVDPSKLGISVQFSKETELLGTGGGLKAAAQHFAREELFLMHNADIYSEINLRALIAAHRTKRPLATLAVMERETSRPLVFDGASQLVGWESKENQKQDLLGAAEPLRRYAFSGIQVLSPEVFNHMAGERGSFSIIRTYMNAARAHKPIVAYLTDEYWLDIGTPDKLKQLNQHLA